MRLRTLYCVVKRAIERHVDVVERGNRGLHADDVIVLPGDCPDDGQVEGVQTGAR
ncbi:MAG: hypothetical protein MNPFHGCM_00351 [Gemmatimonadaceae bacterium]|nr:hypothetical protein [Gemmatimonadaceae bacterium]